MGVPVKRTAVLILHFLCLLTTTFGQNQCYSCNYGIVSGFSSGPKACHEPFNPLEDGIETVDCSGECSYIVQESADIFQVIRECSLLDPCVEFTTTTEDHSSTSYCCSGSLCNDETITNKPPAEPLGDDECYECTYVAGALGTTGSPGCYEPFNASAVGVVKIQCSSSCLLTAVESGGDLVVTRGCHDSGVDCETSCVTSEDDSVCIYCCSPGTVCNKGTLYFLPLSLFLTTFVMCFENF